MDSVFSDLIELNGCTSTRIYCLPDCVPGRRTLAKNRVHFGTRGEARGNGYRPCKVCKPDGATPALERVNFSSIETPLGRYGMVVSERGLTCLGPGEKIDRFWMQWAGSVEIEEAETPLSAMVTALLTEYFAGKRPVIDLPWDLRGTPFQRGVWETLKTIPYGATTSYGEVARTLGVRSSRAIGQAVGRNPVSILIPCHRVIGTDGSLTGYGGGLDRKRWLLAFETNAN